MAGFNAGNQERGSPAESVHRRSDVPGGSASPQPRTPKALEARSKPELYNIARSLKINGRSTMTKEDLIAAIDTRAR
jgi:hypothetical protein